MEKHIPQGEICFLGDLVGYGANPNEVVDWVKAHASEVVKGNHDEAAITGSTAGFNSMASIAIAWTRRVLTLLNLTYLKGLSASKILKIKDVRMLLVHGSPIDELNEYVYPDTHGDLFEFYLRRFDVDLIALGHTHIPFKWSSSLGAVFNPGSVGQPRTGSPNASYAVVDFDSKPPFVEHHLVDYDVARAAGKIRAEGLPVFLADRLFRGI